jgi:hypothetical protein
LPGNGAIESLAAESLLRQPRQINLDRCYSTTYAVAGGLLV